MAISVGWARPVGFLQHALFFYPGHSLGHLNQAVSSPAPNSEYRGQPPDLSRSSTDTAEPTKLTDVPAKLPTRAQGKEQRHGQANRDERNGRYPL
jgi:hypothetical protein